jgi:hypothetical protein
MPDPERRVRPFMMEPETWLDINAATANDLGLPFAELAQRSPTTAYTVLRFALLEFADQAGMGSGELPQGPSYRSIEEAIPPNVEEPTEIQICLLETIGSDVQELPRGEGRAWSVVLSFTVGPPTDLFSG